jgi:methylmalonic aciduria homocystinuria type C protein
MTAAAASLVSALARRLRPSGIDLVQPLNAAWYDAAVTEEYRLPDVGRRDALTVLLASTSAFWEPFVSHLRAEPARLDQPDPIDRYVMDVVGGTLADLPVRHEVRFSHEPPPRRVAMQRLAHVSGLAALTPSMLCVHPVYGPWIALRAAIVLDAPGPAGAPPLPPAPCERCAELCEPALEHAQATVATAGTGDDPVAEHWRLWLAVRDACPVGREHRYPDALIRYVYTKDRAVLRAALRDPSAALDRRRGD